MIPNPGLRQMAQMRFLCAFGGANSCGESVSDSEGVNQGAGFNIAISSREGNKLIGKHMSKGVMNALRNND